jgi:rhodanese-related sulfurtransferase
MALDQDTKSSRALLIGFLAIAGVTFFFVFHNWKRSETPLPETGPEEAARAPFLEAPELIGMLSQDRKESFLLLDVRTVEQYRAAHIAGSKSAPLEMISSSPLPRSDASLTVVLLSSAAEEDRAVQAASVLTRNGFLRVFVLKGGIDEWVRQGGRMLSQGDPKSFVDRSKISILAPESLKGSLDRGEKPVVLDMRPAEKFAQGRVPGAMNIPLAELEERYGEIPAGKRIVAYGDSALEDFQGGVRLFDLNFFGSQVLEGGFNAWKNKGYPTER